MANVYGSAVNFTKELNVWTISAKVTFGSDIGSGSAELILDSSNSKGICAVKYDTVAFSGGTTNSSAVLGTVSSFAGLFNGMTVVGPSGELQSATTISSFTPASKTVTLSKQAITTNTDGNYFARGGRYLFQLGTKEASNLTPFVKVLGVQVSWDMSTGSAVGTATVMQSAPNASQAFIVSNKVSTRTIPATATSGSTDAAIVLQFGYGQGPGTGFVAANPVAGSVARVVFILGNSYNT